MGSEWNLRKYSSDLLIRVHQAWVAEIGVGPCVRVSGSLGVLMLLRGRRG